MFNVSTSFLVNGNSITEKKKTLNCEFWVVSTQAVKICDQLNKNWSSY